MIKVQTSNLRQIKAVLLIVVSFFLLSCTPRYKIAYDYTPPSSKSGLTCATSCQSKLRQCNRQCGVQYSQCSVKAEQRAKKRLPALLKAYPNKLESWLNARERYERDLDWYQFRLDMTEARYDRYLDRCMSRGKKRHSCHRSYSYRHLPYERPTFNIPRPQKPTLTSEAAKIRKVSCGQDCGCQSNYRLCYSSCGGAVTSKRVCIKNCPQ